MNGGTQAAAIVQRRLWTPPERAELGNVSPDGRLLPFISGSDLHIRDLSAETSRQLTRGAEQGQGSASRPLMSPDGKQVAFIWLPASGPGEIRMIGVDGAGPRTLLTDKARYIAPFSWSPDGKQLLLWISNDSTPAKELALFEVATGALRTVRKADWISASRQAFSPDGRFIAYSVPYGEGRQPRVAAVDGSFDEKLTDSGSNPLWSADGRTVLFPRITGGNIDLWSVTVSNGKGVEEARMLRRNLDASFHGMTRSGELFYVGRIEQRDVFVADYDPSSGKVSNARRLNRDHVGATGTSLAWSPDGATLAYTRSMAGAEDRIVFQPAAGEGPAREIPSKESWRHGLQWFADGQSILDLEYSTNIVFHRLDAVSGRATVLFEIPQRKPWVHWQPALSPNGEAVFYSHRESDLMRLMRRTLATGQETELYRTESKGSGFFDLSVSPDGTQIAFTVMDREGNKSWLGRVSTSGGDARLLHERVWSVAGTTWTRDGRRILFGKRVSDGATEIFSIDASGGEPESSGLSMQGLSSLVFHPGGRRIAFTAGRAEQELWVAKNLLPARNGK